MSSTNADDPRLGTLLSRSPLVDATAKVGVIGYPCDEGVARNGGRVGAKDGPSSFRKYLSRLGTVYNPEFGIDLSRLDVRDLGDVDIQSSLEATHEKLQSKVFKAVRDGYIPVVIGGGNDQSYANGKALMQAVQSSNGLSDIGVVNIDAHLDVRPKKVDGSRLLAHSGSPFRQLLEDQSFNGIFVEFAAQGHQCSNAHSEYVNSKGGKIYWLSELRRHGDAVQQFVHVLESMGDKRSIFVSFDVDSIKSADCPGVSCPGSIGLTAEEAFGICQAAGRDSRVKLVDFSEYNPQIEEDRTGRLLVNMLYFFLLGVAKRQ